MPSATQFQSWHERDVLDSTGAKVGKLDGIYTSDATGDADFALVREGILGNHLHFVPTAGAEMVGEDIQVAFDKETILAAPKVKVDEHLTEGEERRLWDHYGLQQPTASVSITRFVYVEVN
jgi:hypothetical protein